MMTPAFDILLEREERFNAARSGADRGKKGEKGASVMVARCIRGGRE